MELLIDDADLKAIEHIYEYYPVDGVTTNPSILAKAGRPPFALLKEIRALIGEQAQLHVQAVAKDAAGMVEDAQRIVTELPGNTYVKIPCVPEGFKAIRLLSEKGIKTTGTAIYTPLQAFLAAKAGAAYAAPYINRIDNFGYDGIAVAETIQDIFVKNQLPTKILAASFKNSEQLLRLCRRGVGAATAAPAVIEGLVKNVAIDAAVDAFVDDFTSLTGKTAMSEL
ncbi:fructose-6-phosphate aldolase 2 [Selenomonas sp. GACV-9]|uniref:transaldolase family protein n=1 Tax=Selenomonas sp. GACV-9 TaxID=3158782 RepID=UPI0008E9D7BF|nr:fructose-6-phosphate aldolase 2 [Selenomonas ruminantium]